MKKDLRIETLAVHAGRQIDKATGAVAAPIHMSTTFERDPDGRWSRGYTYSREENPNRDSLERCLAALENGGEALTFSSGLAVVNAVIQGLEPGDHAIFPDDVYFGLRRVVGEVFAKWPIETTFVNMTNNDALRAQITPKTRLIWCETPSNPMLQITDLAAVAEIARNANAMTVCDSTFMTPILQRPFDFGIDMVMHSTTKYISGHSDVVGGALIAKHNSYLFERCRKSQQYGGAVPSPFDCWLMRRGIDTLALRVRTQSANAMRLAEFLADHPRVEQVNYPGLPSHPQHALAATQTPGGFGGMLSFHIKGTAKDAMAVSNRVRVFTRATSLGGTHSLIEHRASVEGSKSKTPRNLLRVSVGIENVEDLIEDLAHALDTSSV